MPGRVPELALPQVQERPIQAAFNPNRITPAETGAPIAQGIQQAAGGIEQLGQVVQREQDRADFAAAQNAQAKLEAHANSVVYDPKTGLMAQQGQNAVEQSGAAYESLAQKRAELAGTLNDRQKAIFGHRSEEFLLQAQRQIESHVGQQIKFAQGEAYKAVRATALDRVANSYNDPEARDSAIDSMRVDTLIEAKRLGLDANATARMWQEWQQQTAETVLDGYLSERNGSSPDPYAAKDYFDKNKEALGVKAHQYAAKIDETLKSNTVEGAALNIVNGATPDGYQWANPAKAKQFAENLPPDMPHRKDIADRVEHMVASSEAARKSAGESTLNKMLAIYEENGHDLHDPRIAPLKAEMFDENNGWGELYHRLVVEDRQDRRAAKSDARVGSHEQDIANKDAIAEFNQRADKTTLNVETEYLGKADKRTRDVLRGLQQKAQKDEAKGQSFRGEEFASDVRASAEKAWPIQKDKTREQANHEHRAAFQAHMVLWMHEQEQTGKPPTRAEVKAEENQYLIPRRVKGLFFDRDVVQGELKPGDKAVPPSTQRTPAVPAGKIRVQNAAGQSGTIPASNLDAWLKANPGGKKL